jgi:hypothetical protein
MSGKRNIFSTLNNLFAAYQGQRGFVSYFVLKHLPFRINLCFRKRQVLLYTLLEYSASFSLSPRALRVGSLPFDLSFFEAL